MMMVMAKLNADHNGFSLFMIADCLLPVTFIH